ncbi:HIT family protein [Halalkalibacter alkaliphilus]|uniref:HIT family protein n=1 Tax=Halalkalibacter alkaliphilus TaxID=2917993 RepID=A0A9X2CVB1_9BACI|nr:HIT family protein [Halalkalibacter alkaliphilus]MCL7748775.1 HIT family protein [Halalkalibacter alkaliphilus]
MKEKACPFCTIGSYLVENQLAYAIYDQYPVSKGHALIIPKRHVADYFDTTEEEKEALHSLVQQVRELQKDQFSPDGFNVGMNCGEAAGQTIFHAHIHVIPRYKGDMANPRGGVRGVIPSKQSY